jgi:hypothetical protein
MAKVESSITITMSHLGGQALLEILNRAEHSTQSGYLSYDCRDKGTSVEELHRAKSAEIRVLHAHLKQVFPK